MKLLENLKKVRSMLSDKSKWVQNHYAVDINGKPVSISSDDACAWCLAGALGFVCLNVEEADEIYSHLKSFIENRTISSFNDSSKTTYDDVSNLIDEGISSLQEI